MDSKLIYDEVNKRYGAVTKSATGKYERNVAEAFGYAEDELTGLPEGANLGLSCGNPTAIANLKEGETVIDLGSGAGFDVFISSRKVGATGKAIGVDMNKDMIAKANVNKDKINAENVQFVQSPVTAIPLPDATADCIISNCVINLVPKEDKQLAFNEMFRLLKPGGRVAVSDILARKEFTEKMSKNIALYVGCMAGASLVGEYETYLKNAGFEDILIVDNKSDLNVYFTAEGDGSQGCGPGANAPGDESSSCCEPCLGPPKQAGCCSPEEEDSCCGDQSAKKGQDQDGSFQTGAQKMAADLGYPDFNEWAGSFKIYSVKPKAITVQE